MTDQPKTNNPPQPAAVLVISTPSNERSIYAGLLTGRVAAVQKVVEPNGVRLIPISVVDFYADRPPACGATKAGEFNRLRCCSPAGHKGEHCYVVAD